MQTFSYEEFMKLRGLALGNYIPLPGEISDETLTRLASTLLEMDDEHLTCAVVILGQHSPILLLPFMCRLLADSRVSVHSAAERVLLNRMPLHLVSASMRDQFICIVSQRSDTSEYVLDQLMQRFQS